jgi:zinc/manganese transport system substrate-binding protein
VVAAENFYGNLIKQVGGDRVHVTSVISDPGADPHLFATGTANALAVAKARVVVVNGAGYDSWMDRLINASPKSDRQVVTVADVLGVTGSNPNPHLWYDAPRMSRVVEAIGQALETADPPHQNDYRDGVRRTVAALQPLLTAVADLRARFARTPVAYTERVAGYLLDAAGLDVRTPPAFSNAIEEATDPPPSATQAMEQLLRTHGIRVLLYNEQAVSALTKRLQRLANQNRIPIVGVTETLPAGLSFQEWQLRQVQQLRAALER